MNWFRLTGSHPWHFGASWRRDTFGQGNGQRGPAPTPAAARRVVAPASHRPWEARFSGARARAPRALVIEDAEESREMFACALELSGFRVSRASDGEEGLKQMRRFEPDVIVLDLVLPGVNGFSVARTVRALERHWNVAILAVSGLTSEVLRTEALGSGCDAFLRKPVAPATVVELARLVLARRAGGGVTPAGMKL
jgi:two-component system cell cycle response regulator DivK